MQFESKYSLSVAALKIQISIQLVRSKITANRACERRPHNGLSLEMLTRTAPRILVTAAGARRSPEIRIDLETVLVGPWSTGGANLW